MDLRTKVVTAMRWTVVARLLGQVSSWAITILVIRILTPEDYGLMAMVAVIVAFFYLINTLGLDAILIQRERIDEQTRREVFGFVILLNLAIFALLVAGAPLIADFYGEPRLTDITRVLAFQFVLWIFETLPQSRLGRELEFKRQSIVDLATLLAGSVVTLLLAYAGFGVWALVWGALLTTATRMLGLNLICWQPCRPRFVFSALRAHIRFGTAATVDRVLRHVFAEVDKFIGGKLLGKELLGYYAVASHLAALPIHKLSGLINAVAFPAFARVQADPEKMRSYVLKASSVMSVVAFPVFFGMSSVAPELVIVLLGEKWVPATLALQLVSLAMPLRMLLNLFQPVLWGIGRPDVSARNFLFAATMMPLAFLIGAIGWGLAGMAFAWLIAFPIVFLASVARAVAVLGIGLREFLATMFPAAAASAVMYVAVVWARFALGQDAPDVWQLLQLVAAGMFIYPAALYVTRRETIRETLEFVRHY